MGSYYESLDRVVFLGLSTLVILLVVGTASGSDGVTLFQDDFNTKEPYWDFREWDTGTVTVRNGILSLNLTDESKVGEGSLALAWEGEAPYTWRPLHPWLYVSMEMKIRFSDDNKLVSDIGGGVRWWGLLSEWAFAKNELKFLSFSPEAGPLYGFGVVTSTGRSSGYAYMGNITGIDVTEWHTYTIHWEHDNATFLVDGQVIGSTDKAPNIPIFALAAIHNYDGEGYIDLDVDQSMQVDYIRIFTTQEKFQDWSEEITPIFSEAAELIETLEEKGHNLQEAKEDYSKAEDLWREGYYNFDAARKELEKIIGNLGPSLEQYDEIGERFVEAEFIVGEAERKGMEEAPMMRNNYEFAETSWGRLMLSATETSLNMILAKRWDVLMFGRDTVLVDDFENESIGPGWSVYTSDTGTINVAGGCAYLNITDQSKQEYSHGTLQTMEGFKSVGIEMRLRCSDDNNMESDIGGGLRVWGFRDQGVLPQSNGMQFICFSPESHPEWSGLSALNVFSSKASTESITGVDISDWHIYTITRELGNATFLIDGELVASFDQVTDQSMHPYAAIANTKFGGGEFGVLSNWGYDDISFDEHVEIDYVHLFGIPEAVTPSILSILGLILLPPLGRRAHTG